MLKKVSACTAVLAVAVTALTGCTGKLSAEETCTYLNDKAEERNLDQKTSEGAAALLQGDTEKFKDSAVEAASLLREASGQSSDAKLADALNLIADMTDKMSSAVTVDGMSVIDISAKFKEFDTPELAAAEDYMNSVCPGMASIN